jgi:hypothetical protein
MYAREKQISRIKRRPLWLGKFALNVKNKHFLKLLRVENAQNVELE